MDAGQSWALSNQGLEKVNARSIAFDPHNEGTIYIGALFAGVFRSTDGGASWQPYSAGMGPYSIVTMNWDATGTELYAAAADGFAYKLLPNTSTWALLSVGLPQTPIGEIFPHPTLPHVLFASTGQGIYLTIDDGATWYLSNSTPSGLMLSDGLGFAFYAIGVHGGLYATADVGTSWFNALIGFQNVFVGTLAAVNNNNTSVLYAGSDFGPWITASGGAPWGLVPNFERSIFELIADPSNSGTLYIGTEKDGVWKSTDAGFTWSQSSTGIVPRQIFGIAQSPAAPNTIYAATATGLYISRDRSNNWSTATSSQLPKMFCVAADPVRYVLAYAGSINGSVFKTVDGGYTFYPLSTNLPVNENVLFLKVSPQFADQLYAITSGGGLYASSDAGNSWFPDSQGVPYHALAMDVDPTRPWILYLGTAGGGIYKSTSTGGQWSSTGGGLGSPYVFSVAVDPGNPDTVYAGTSAGVYKSTDGGDSWQPAMSGLPTGTVTSIVIDIRTGSSVFASIQDNGVYRTTDGGTNWSPAYNGLPMAGAVPIALDVTDSTRLYAGSSNGTGMYLSTNSGQQWNSQSTGMTIFVRGLGISEAAPATVFAATLLGGVFKSTDGGTTWGNSGLVDEFLFKVAVDPANPDLVYVASSNGVRKSSNGGGTWTTLGEPATVVFSMASDPNNRNTVYLGTTAGGVFKSTDGGTSWTHADAGLPARNILALTVDSATGTLYASPEQSGVYRSSNGGASWAQTDNSLIATTQITSLIVDTKLNLVYASSNGQGVFISFDHGDNWITVNSGLTTMIVNELSVDSLQTGIVYAATAGGGVFKSKDGGNTWNPFNSGLGNLSVNAVRADPQQPGAVYAATQGGVYKSTDGAMTWTPTNTGLTAASIATVDLSSYAAGTIYAGTNGAGIFKSTDHGDTWTPLNTGVSNLSVRVFAEGPSASVLYAGSLGAGVIQTTNGGQTWTPGATPEAINPFVLALAIDPVHPSTIYAGTSSGVLKSADGGQNWISLNSGLTSSLVLALAIDPANTSTVYVGTSGSGVFVSENGGETWVSLPDGMFHKNVTSIAIDKLNHKIVYAGTEGGGIFKNVRP
jgi:photosystem II stability/assembly factor-like uncharacterized protein